jgi:hypothetical protein
MKNPAPFQISRRSFVKRCAMLAAATGLPLWFVERQLVAAERKPRRLGPNDRPRIALIGCGSLIFTKSSSVSASKKIFFFSFASFFNSSFRKVLFSTSFSLLLIPNSAACNMSVVTGIVTSIDSM